MFHWGEEDGSTGYIVDRIIATTENEELNDLEVIEEIYNIIASAHQRGII
jgi:hypothetical protein